MKKPLFLNVLWVLLSIACFTTQAKVIYVNHNPSSNGNTGVDWANAYADLQVAMDAAVEGDMLWVAGGTYKPEFDVRTAFEAPEERYIGSEG
jgi:hypothetical protein